MVGTWPKPATSKLSLLVRSVKGTGSAAARAAAAGEAGEPSDGGRSCIGASAVGAVGGGIHRCGSLRGAGRRLWTDRSSAGGVQVGRSTVKRASARTRETYKGRYKETEEQRAPWREPKTEPKTLTNILSVPEGDLLTEFAMRSDPNVVFG